MSRALRLFVIVVLVISALSIPITALADAPQDTSTSPYIVSFASSTTDANGLAASLGQSNGFQVEHSFNTLIKGFSAWLTPRQVSVLSALSQVVQIEPDLPVQLADTQSVPTGVDRIGTTSNSTASIDGSGADLNIAVATLDTGVDPTHPDLNVAGGYNCTDENQPDAWTDDNGHGTHVAGIIAAQDNGIGVVGVAPGARIWAVKVFDSSGNGSVSEVICGMNWIAAHAQEDAIRVVNFSGTWGGTNSGNCGTSSNWWMSTDSAHQAVCNLVNTNDIPFVVAAGNGTNNNGHGVNAWRTLPAAYPETIAVGAIADSDGQPGGLGQSTWAGADDTRASFSNFGNVVTLYAPGVNITSTWNDGGYRVDSGTSMAAPHVTGAVALYLLNHSTASPDQVKRALVASGEPGSWGAPYGNQPLLNVSNPDFGGSAPRQIWESDLTVSAAGGKVMTGQVTVTSDSGPVANASVTLHITGGSFLSSRTAIDVTVTTGNDGVAPINVSLDSAGFYSVRVTNISHDGDVYAANRNVVWSRSVYIK